MQFTTKIYRLQGKVQHYAWGGQDFIPRLLHQANTDKKPFAEYWMGAHDNVPATIVLPGGSVQPLNDFIKSDPAGILGEKVYHRFGRLPYLFKVLDVKDMLSIQVHPDKRSAEIEFAEENSKGISPAAPNRNYKDDNHKPELMFALSEFWLLHGFKAPEALMNVLQQTPELQFLITVFQQQHYEGLYKRVMEMKQQEVNERLQPLLNRVIPLYEKGLPEKDKEDFWAARAAKTFCTGNDIDRGIFSIYLFNLVHLQPGEAVFQDAGILHAYLEGQNMEIMANSDNVLRGGLTNKHIDVNELMKHVRFGPVVVAVIKGMPGTVEQEKIFPTPVLDFELRQVTIKKNESITLSTGTAEIFFVYKGSLRAICEATELALKKGESMLAVAGATIQLKGLEDAVIFRATAPAGQDN